jgi:hypothetical protein
VGEGSIYPPDLGVFPHVVTHAFCHFLSNTDSPPTSETTRTVAASRCTLLAGMSLVSFHWSLNCGFRAEFFFGSVADRRILICFNWHIVQFHILATHWTDG